MQRVLKTLFRGTNSALKIMKLCRNMSYGCIYMVQFIHICFSYLFIFDNQSALTFCQHLHGGSEYGTDGICVGEDCITDVSQTPNFAAITLKLVLGFAAPAAIITASCLHSILLVDFQIVDGDSWSQ